LFVTLKEENFKIEISLEFDKYVKDVLRVLQETTQVLQKNLIFSLI